MKLPIDDIISLIRKARRKPHSLKEVDFLGNIWDRICGEYPVLTQKQIRYLRRIANRRPRVDFIEIQDEE